jgi:hypothetical protein
MKISTVILAAALGAVVLPVAAFAAGDEQRVKLVYNAKMDKYCLLSSVTGQYLPVRDCRTKEEWVKAGAKFSDASTDKPADRLAQK